LNTIYFGDSYNYAMIQVVMMLQALKPNISVAWPCGQSVSFFE